MNKLPTLAIIGPGRVGTSIGILATRAGYPVVAVGGQRKESTAAAAQRIGKDVRVCDTAEAAKSAQIVLLCLPDDVIEGVCKKLAQQDRFIEGGIVAHGLLKQIYPVLAGCEIVIVGLEPKAIKLSTCLLKKIKESIADILRLIFGEIYCSIPISNRVERSLNYGHGEFRQINGKISATVRAWALAWSVLCGADAENQDSNIGMGGVMLESTDWHGGLRDRQLLVDSRQQDIIVQDINTTIEKIKTNVFPFHGL